jgi:hypothetical protein
MEEVAVKVRCVNYYTKTTFCLRRLVKMLQRILRDLRREGDRSPSRHGTQETLLRRAGPMARDLEVQQGFYLDWVVFGEDDLIVLAIFGKC